MASNGSGYVGRCECCGANQCAILNWVRMPGTARARGVCGECAEQKVRDVVRLITERDTELAERARNRVSARAVGGLFDASEMTNTGRES